VALLAAVPAPLVLASLLASSKASIACFLAECDEGTLRPSGTCAAVNIFDREGLMSLTPVWVGLNDADLTPDETPTRR
jgi:hypothetical protein